MALEKVLTEFEQSAAFFGQLATADNHSLREGGSTVADGAYLYFHRAAYANAILYSAGTETLRELETKRIIHPSTLEGGSLDTAMRAVNEYFFDDKRHFAMDDYEQLARSCRSVCAYLKHTRKLPERTTVFRGKRMPTGLSGKK